VRESLNWPDETAEKLKTGGLDRLFNACDEQGVPLLLMSGGEPALVGLVAERYPSLALTIDHIGMRQPPVWQEADTPPFKALPQLLDLAKYDNVTVKFSGAPTLTAEPYPFADLWPHLNQIVEAFGPERLMWGTDIQRVNGRVAHHTWEFDFVGKHSYGEAVGFLRDTDELSQSDKEQIFAGTLRRVLGWPS
jgi:L-fuconolactonase